MDLTKRGCGGIGRREGLKNLWDNLPCGFDSHHPHHHPAIGVSKLSPAGCSFMKKPEIDFNSIPSSAISETTLKICLKCAFDFFAKQLKLTPRTAYTELKKHVPEEADFTGAATARPHFFGEGDTAHCPYCNGAKRWFADFKAIRIDAHPSYEK